MSKTAQTKNQKLVHNKPGTREPDELHTEQETIVQDISTACNLEVDKVATISNEKS